MGNVLVVDVVEELMGKTFSEGKSNRWLRGCAFSSEGSVSPEPWPFSKVDSIFPHVRLHCVLTMGVKTWVGFLLQLVEAVLDQVRVPTNTRVSGFIFTIRRQTREPLRMFDLHKRLLKIY